MGHTVIRLDNGKPGNFFLLFMGIVAMVQKVMLTC